MVQGMTSEHFRRRGRRSAALPVRYSLGTAPERTGSIIDLHLEGAFIATHSTPQEGTRVRLRFASPTAWDPVLVDGEVRWVRTARDGDPGFGVRFDPLGPAEAAALAELVEASAYEDEDDAK
jgi:PilZ domain